MAKLSVDGSIIAQVSAKVAADLVAPTVTVDSDLATVVENYEAVQAAVFNGTLALIGIDSIEELLEAEVVNSRGKGGGSYGGGKGGGGGQADDAGAGVVIKFGKYQGKTIAQVHDTEPSYIEWLAENANSAFLKGKAQEFLSSLAA